MIITADLHLTDSQKDAYRFGIFDFLEECLDIYGETEVAILGDITDFKDNHSYKLVNQIVNGLVKLSKKAKVYIIPGNHDFIIEGKPYLEFIKHIPGINYMLEPSLIEGELGQYLFLPNCSNPQERWSNLNLKKPDFIFFHDAVIGSVASDTYQIDHGLNATFFKDTDARVYAGDIHVPQEVRNVTYCGAPYRIRYGDNYDPRILRLTADGEEDLFYPCLNKATIKISSVEELEEFDIAKGDQLKIRIEMDKASISEWSAEKKKVLEYLADKGVDIGPIELKVKQKRKKITKKIKAIASDKSHASLVSIYAEHENIEDSVTKHGLAIIEESL